MNTYTPDTLPVKLEILSHWGDNRDYPSLRFIIRLEMEGRSMVTEYGGGMLAFGANEDPAIKLERKRNFGDNAINHLLSGKRLINRKDEFKILNYLASRAKIKVSGVCHSLVCDTRAGEMTFPNFCEEFGYDEDSRKALEIYMKCQKIGKDFRALVGDKFDAIAKALEDY